MPKDLIYLTAALAVAVGILLLLADRKSLTFLIGLLLLGGSLAYMFLRATLSISLEAPEFWEWGILVASFLSMVAYIVWLWADIINRPKPSVRGVRRLD